MSSWLGIMVIALVFGMMVLAGCASAPPMAFETDESLENTGWSQTVGGRNSLIIMDGKTTGYLLDSDNNITQFTYTAVYNASQRSFAGNIIMEDGMESEFTVIRRSFYGWELSAKSLNQHHNFYYVTEERLEDIYNQRRIRTEIIERYGSEYLDLNNKVYKLDNEEIYIGYNTIHGLHHSHATGDLIRVGATRGFKLHSKDGITMTLLSINERTFNYNSVDGAGTFNISVNGDTITISNGTGAGTAFNGTWNYHRPL